MVDIGKLVTIVVPVRERHYNLPKIIKYYGDFGCQKIIYDSSEERYTGDTGDFNYVHAGPQFQHKAFYTAYSMVETPFLVNCPDDDLMVKSSIEKCASFLADNPDYVACHGEYVNFDPNGNSLQCHGPNIYTGRVSYEYTGDFEEALDFLIVRCSRSPLHALVRTEDARDIYKNFLDNKIISPLGFQDRVYSFATACRGKVKTLPVPWHIRMTNEGPAADRIMHRSNIADEVIDGYSLSLHINMENCIDDEHCSAFSKYFAEATGLTARDAMEKTKEVFKKHYEFRKRYIPMYGRGFLLPQDRPDAPVEFPHKSSAFEEELREVIEVMGG